MMTLEKRLLKKGYEEFFFSFKEMKIYKLCDLNVNTAVIRSEDRTDDYYVIIRPQLDKDSIKWDLKFGVYKEKEAREYARELDNKLTSSIEITEEQHTKQIVESSAVEQRDSNTIIKPKRGR